MNTEKGLLPVLYCALLLHTNKIIKYNFFSWIFALYPRELKMIFKYNELEFRHVSRCTSFCNETNVGSVLFISIITCWKRGPGYLSRYSESLRAGRSGDRTPVGGKIFCTRPDRPWDPPNLLYNEYRVLPPGVKRPGRGVNHTIPSSAEVKERVKLYIYSTSGPSWPVLGWALPLHLPLCS